MSVCGHSGQAEEDSASEEVAASATRDIYKQKPASKVVRVLTVLAYLLSVSLAAILLSVYYICVWRSPELPLEADSAAGEPGEASARRDNHSQYQHHQDIEHVANITYGYGGGNTTVNGDIIHLQPENITGDFTEDSVTKPTADSPNATVLSESTPGLHNGTSEFSTFNDTDSVT